ncbi:unnamed protein product [Ectocarpus sp. CCAP 1310/34]|nr:unnamed protein product [Ectocarpus sp. CCAP 1310/34]
MRSSQHGLACPPATATETKAAVKSGMAVTSDRAAAPCRRRRESRRMQHSSMTLGLCALLRPRRGSAWGGGHVVVEGWRHPVGPFIQPQRQQQQKVLDDSLRHRFDATFSRHSSGGCPRRGNRRPRVLMSSVAASDSGSNSGGSMNTAAAAASSPFPEGEDAAALPRPLPPLLPPAPSTGQLNGGVSTTSAATLSEAARSSEANNINTSSASEAQGRRRARGPPQRREENQKEDKDVCQENQWGVSTSQLEQQQQQQQQQQQAKAQEMRQLGKKGKWREALEVLRSIPGPSRQKQEYVAAIAACDFAREPRQALRVHGLMVQQGLEPTPESVLLVVRGLLQAGDATTALRVFRSSGVGIRGRPYKAGRTADDSASTMNALYAVVIRAAQKAGDWRLAVVLYREMEAVKPGPSAATATAVFLACYAEQEYAAAASFASDALRPPWEEVTRRRVLMNKIIVACGRAGPDNYQQALDTFEDLDRTIGADGYTLTAVIDVLRRVGDWRRALALLDRLTELGVTANRGLRTSVNAVLSAMGPDNYRRARELVEKATVEWGVDGDVVTYGTLLLLASARLPPPAPLGATGTPSLAPAAAAAAAVPPGSAYPADGPFGGEGGQEEESGQWETVNVFRWAVAAKEVPSEACLDMVMFGLARDGLWEEATAFVEAIGQAGLKREALLSALSNGEQWAGVVALVKSMLVDLEVVDNATVGLAMKAYAKLGLETHWRSALSVIKQAQRASRGRSRVVAADVLDGSAWRCLLAGLASEGLHEEAGVVMQAMAEARVRVDKDSTAAVVLAAYKAGDHAAAIAWVDRLDRAGLPVSRNGYTAGVNACCALGKPDAAISILGMMLEGRLVPTASVYNAVLESICPASEGGYSARVRLRDSSPALSGGRLTEEADGSGGEEELNGLFRARERREDGERDEPAGLIRDTTAAAKADRALSLFEEMWAREVPMNGVTYAIVICALLRAEREDQVLRLWTLAWSDPRTKKLRTDMSNRALGICKDQRRGALAVRLLQLGARLSPKGLNDVAWPGPGPYWVAMEACEREGATAWRDALALVDKRNRSPLPPDDSFSEAGAGLLQQAAALGVSDAVQAASTRVWEKREKKSNSSGGGGGRRVGRFRAAAAAAAAAASAAVDQRATSAD